MRVAGGATSDAIVVGAGIVGAACAEALARDGWRVTILEETFAASGTTAAGMGHIVVMDDSPEQLALTAYSDRLWRELGLDSDRRSEVERCGTLWIAEDATQLAALEAKREAYAGAGVATRGPRRARPRGRRANAAARARGSASRSGGFRRLSARRNARVASSRAIAAEPILREGVRVDELDSGFVRTQAGETMRADVVVNAAGARAAQLTPELPIVPRKGHLAITDRTSHVCRHQLVELGYLTSAHSMTTESVAFNLQPRRTGQMLIGSSRELVGWDASINRAVLRRMLASRRGVRPEPREPVGDPLLDGISSGDSRQASADRRVGSDSRAVDRRGARRTRDHDVARHRRHPRRPRRRPSAGDRRGAVRTDARDRAARTTKPRSPRERHGRDQRQRSRGPGRQGIDRRGGAPVAGRVGVSHFGERRASRASLRNGDVLRVPGHDRRRRTPARVSW